MSDVREYKLLIDGQFVDAAGGETIESTDPSTGAVVGRIAKGGKEDVRKAIEAARKAFDSGVWSNMTQAERTKRMLKLWEILQERLMDLAQIESQDAGHTIRMANLFSIALGVEHWRAQADLAEKLGEYEPVEQPNTASPAGGIVRREPFGVCGAITPWNFPFILMIWKAAPALATGNTMVMKPATYTPMSTAEFGKILTESDLFPPGVFNVVPGSGGAAGEELASNPLVDKVSFTGSTEVGRRVMQLASSTIKYSTMELGGKSANIILDDADLDVAVPGSLWATFLHSGQICHSGTRAFVPASMYDEVIARMVELAEGLKVGPAADFETDLGPLVHRTQYETVERYVQLGQQEGAKLVTGGERVNVAGHDGGYYYKPTVFADVNNTMRIAQEEIFGPVLSVIKYDTVDEAIARANDSIYGLAGGVWSHDIPRALEVAKRMRTGTVWINDYHLLSAYGPFGGYKQSGVGRELGVWGIRGFQQVKYIHVDQTPRKDQKFWYQIAGL